jgi:Xaa-Pro dipeptidase
MVFSNEPGIYRPGIDGYRTIDTMIVTTAGVDIPSTFQARVPWTERVIPHG